MNTNNGFDLMVAVSFTIIPQLRVNGTKPSGIINSLTLKPNETIPYLNICTFRFCIKIILVKAEMFQKNDLTGTYLY